jgi:hypothetical protein
MGHPLQWSQLYLRVAAWQHRGGRTGQFHLLCMLPFNTADCLAAIHSHSDTSKGAAGVQHASGALTAVQHQ